MVSLAAVHVDAPRGTDILLERAAEALRARGVRLAGVVQTNTARANRARCDMNLAVLPTGRIVRISQDRGEGARGCHLDHGALEEAVVQVEQTIRSRRPDLVIINKFGKQEAQGRGFVPVISAALEAGIPVLVGVSNLNRDEFETFASGLARKLPPDGDAVLDWCLTASGRTATLSQAESKVTASVA